MRVVLHDRLNPEQPVEIETEEIQHVQGLVFGTTITLKTKEVHGTRQVTVRENLGQVHDAIKGAGA